MTDPVVDRFEVVDIDDDQRKAPSVTLSTRDLSAEEGMKEALIEQPGQRIEIGDLPRGNKLAAPAKCQKPRDCSGS